MRDLQEPDLYGIIVTEYEREGLDVVTALEEAERKLRKCFRKYLPTGPDGGRWMDNETLVGLARFYHVDVVILNPDASWTVVEETPGQAAPHRAHVALAGEHYRPLVPLTDDSDLSAITSAQPQFLAATSAKLDQRRACLQAVERGTGLISAVDAVDQLEFIAAAPTTQAARRATAQAAIQRVSAAQDRLALARALLPQPEPVVPPRRAVKKSGTGAKRGRGGTQAVGAVAASEVEEVARPAVRARLGLRLPCSIFRPFKIWAQSSLSSSSSRAQFRRLRPSGGRVWSVIWRGWRTRRRRPPLMLCSPTRPPLQLPSLKPTLRLSTPTGMRRSSLPNSADGLRATRSS